MKAIDYEIQIKELNCQSDSIPIDNPEELEKYFAEINSDAVLKKIWGSWPGDESIDELLAALGHGSV